MEAIMADENLICGNKIQAYISKSEMVYMELEV